ncbi:uncharacterized protein [Anas acuta]|uniref:uncharacterized protein isoform X2 n=1 Tax=Anas acuta TaxID=28680 RepID=UPI0035C88DFF
MVKLFIGNLPREATEQEIRSLFEQYGKVLECDIIKNYGFVHIEDRTAAEDAIRNLHHHKLHGVCINVEASKNKSKASTKLHVGNISPACTNLELRAKFEEYGPVIECDIVKDYAFVHMERAEDAVEAIRGLDNTEFQGGDPPRRKEPGRKIPPPKKRPWVSRARGLAAALRAPPGAPRPPPRQVWRRRSGACAPHPASVPLPVPPPFCMEVPTSRLHPPHPPGGSSAPQSPLPRLLVAAPSLTAPPPGSPPRLFQRNKGFLQNSPSPFVLLGWRLRGGRGDHDRGGTLFLGAHLPPPLSPSPDPFRSRTVPLFPSGPISPPDPRCVTSLPGDAVSAATMALNAGAEAEAEPRWEPVPAAELRSRRERQDRTILLQDKQQQLLCVTCSEPDGERDGDALEAPPATPQPSPPCHPAAPRPEHCEGAASGRRGGVVPPPAVPPPGPEVAAAAAAVLQKLGWAARELPRTASAEGSAQLCALVRACAEALRALRGLDAPPGTPPGPQTP